MIATTLTDLAAQCGGEVLGGEPFNVFDAVSTDTRSLMGGELFVALAGERFDAHHFLDAAIEEGAAGLLISDASAWQGSREDRGEKRPAVILVDDTLLALQRLAAFQRGMLEMPVIVVTGSSGKTSTKDMLAAVLGRRYKVSATRGNLNNHIGLPLSILEVSAEHSAAVWEIGMNHRGEIAPLAAIARPDVAVVTNVGVAHIEHLGSREEICEEKGDLIAALREGGTAIFPAADEFADRLAQRTACRVIRPSFGEGEVAASEVVSRSDGTMAFVLECGGETAQVRLPVLGRHMVANALLAAAVGYLQGIPVEEIAEALGGVSLGGGRLQRHEVNGVVLIDDSYNANPESMAAALQTLGAQPCAGRRIAVLGGMAELGDFREREHRRIGALAAKRAIDLILSVGDEAIWIGEEAEQTEQTELAERGKRLEHMHFDTHSACVERLKQIVSEGDCILFKGSRSARMELVLEGFNEPLILR